MVRPKGSDPWALFARGAGAVLFNLTQRRKKIPEQRARRRCPYAIVNLGPVVHRWLGENARAMDDGAALGIVGAVIEPRDAGMSDRARAHCAGFEGDKEVAPVEAIVAKPCRRGANRDDFGMRGGIVRFAGTIMAFADNRAILDDDCADRHFAPVRCGFGEVERAAHRFGKRKLRHRFSR